MGRECINLKESSIIMFLVLSAAKESYNRVLPTK